jgi:hypothetical protein
MSSRINLRDGLIIWLSWILLSALGGGIGFYLGLTISVALPDFTGRVGIEVVLFGIFGATIGLAQWIIMRNLIPNAGLWILGTFLVWLVLGVLSDTIEKTFNHSWAPTLAGAIIGKVQALILRPHISWAATWIIASTLGWVIGWHVAAESDEIVGMLVNDEIVTFAILYAIVAGVTGVFTGLMLVLLFSRNHSRDSQILTGEV